MTTEATHQDILNRVGAVERRLDDVSAEVRSIGIKADRAAQGADENRHALDDGLKELRSEIQTGYGGLRDQFTEHRMEFANHKSRIEGYGEAVEKMIKRGMWLIGAMISVGGLVIGYLALG